MGVTNSFELRATDSLWVDRTKRQRREIFNAQGNFINPDGLLESVRLHGVLSALLVTREGEIIFGERRWTASKLCELPTCPVRYVEDLEPHELRVIELEENLRRSDLPWRDEVRAISELHEMYKLREPSWTMKDTARALQLSDSRVSEFLRVAEDLESPRIERAGTMREAYNTLSRVDERRTVEVMEEILGGAAEIFRGDAAGDGTGAGLVRGGDGEGPEQRSFDPATHPTGHPQDQIHPSAPIPRATLDPILTASFLKWAPQYTGPRFNLIHCDFPYGINLFAGKFSGRDSSTSYNDDKDTYIALIECLCTNLDRLMAHSAHLVFWLSADLDIQYETKKMFAKLAPDLLFWRKVLVWHKTDNVGIIANPRSDPRHVYETALVASREDRVLVRSVADAYGAPTDKKWHPSTKPEPVLRHFLSMFVDEHTKLLDPTCGGGSALRAAESLGAESVLGLEIDPEHAENARIAMKQFRTLRSTE